jgi:hypothetical protein
MHAYTKRKISLRAEQGDQKVDGLGLMIETDAADYND